MDQLASVYDDASLHHKSSSGLLTPSSTRLAGEAIACGLLFKNGKYGLYPQALFKYSVLHSALVGGFANGPMLQIFFQQVDYWINFKSRVLNVVAKVVVDQVVWGCLWNWMYILLMNIATDSPGFGYIGEGLGVDRWHIKLYKGFVSAFWKASDWSLHVKLLTEGELEHCVRCMGGASGRDSCSCMETQQGAAVVLAGWVVQP